jgi:translation initiation factor IF-3
MRISKKKRPEKAIIPNYKKNYEIESPEVRVLNQIKENIGLMKTKDAIKMAMELECDLVEINPKASPPVAQIIEYSSFKYQKEKEIKKQRANSKVSDLKVLRLSIRISDHDLGIRLEQALKFLNRGDKVKPEVVMRGREGQMTHLAFEVINQFIAQISAKISIRFEQEVVKQGDRVTATFIKA